MQIRDTLLKFPGIGSPMETFLTERIEETTSGYTAAVVISVFGNDLDTLDRRAGEVANVLERVRGATDVQLRSPPGSPQLVIKLRPDALARWGFDPVDVLEAVRTAYGGETVGQVYEGNRVSDVSVILAPEERHSVAKVSDLPLRGPDGNYVALRQLADVYESPGRYIILHRGVRRVQTVTCNVQDRDVGSFVAEAPAAHPESPSHRGNLCRFRRHGRGQTQSQRDLLLSSFYRSPSSPRTTGIFCLFS
jgi:Cu/Ag efflux pump CusA